MKRKDNTSFFEEIFNVISHTVGVILGIIALVVLVIVGVQSKQVEKIIGFSIFGATFILMYLMSIIFHSLVFTRAKKILRILEHSSIFLFIAGTYTPFILIYVKGLFEWIFLSLIWTAALCGIIFKIFYIKRNNLSILLYVLFGWFGIFAIKPLITNLNFNGLLLLFTGGALYSIGIIFYLWRRLMFSHTIWHIFVLGGSISHFATMFYL